MKTTDLAFRRWQLWPLFLLLLAEAVAWWVFPDAPGQPLTTFLTPFSALVAGLILLSGLLPALLRPAPETLLAGCLATVLSSILVTPFSVARLPLNFFNTPVIQAITPFLFLRLLNGISLGPLAFHLAARFPIRSAVSSRRLAFGYLLSYALLVVFLIAPWKPLRIVAGLALLTWCLALLIRAVSLLLKASRLVDPENPRPAQQARLLFFSISLGSLLSFLRPLGIIFRTELISYDLMLASLTLIPLGIAYAVLRHDLFGIDRALRRGLAYAALSVFLLVVYFALTVGLTAELARLWPGLRGLAALISLFIAALAFEPSRRFLQYGVDRVLYPDRLNFQQAVAEARLSLTHIVSREQIVQLLSQDLPPKLGAEWASLTLAPQPDIPGSVSSQPAWNAQLVVGGQLLGRYWLGPRRAGPSYDPDEQAQLHALAGQAAQALAYAEALEAMRQLNRELEARVAQRTAQVIDQQRALAAHAERQRLARDLHDSVTQALFSINLSARALRRLVRRDPEAAISGLGELEQAAQQALAEMRALLAQLRAPSPELESNSRTKMRSDVSEKVDLVALIQEYSARLTRDPAADEPSLPFQVKLTSPLELWLPASLAYELAQATREALQNAAKYSRVDQAQCEIIQADGWLHVTVRDQGVGFDILTVPADRFGLRGMRERLAALGGELTIQTAPGQGAIIQALLPVEDYGIAKAQEVDQ